MTAAAVPSSLPVPAEEFSPVMEGVSWETYERLRTELDEAGSIIRITYDRGRMVLMSPLPRHGKWSRLIGQLIAALAMVRTKSTWWRLSTRATSACATAV